MRQDADAVSAADVLKCRIRYIRKRQLAAPHFVWMEWMMAPPPTAPSPWLLRLCGACGYGAPALSMTICQARACAKRGQKE